jgi:hypothetical protein
VLAPAVRAELCDRLNHIIWADGSPDPEVVAGVCADDVLPSLKQLAAQRA